MTNPAFPSTGDVLVVDDDVLLVEVIGDLLAHEGYAVRKASDMMEALTAIATKPPALLLLDLHMPGITGGQLRTLVRAHGYTFPIAIITGSPEMAEEFLGQEQVTYIEKPFELESVLSCVALYVRPERDSS